MMFRQCCVLLLCLLAAKSKCGSHPEVSHHHRSITNGNSVAEKVDNIQQKPSDFTIDDITNLMWRCYYSNDTTSDYNVFPDYTRFNNTVVTYKILNYTTDLSLCQIRNTLKRAFRTWEEVTEITFRESVGNDNIDMKIEFVYGEHLGDSFTFGGIDTLVAHAFPGGDIHFDDAELWSLGRGRIYTKTYFGNSNGASCTFPFIYKGRQQTRCLPIENMRGQEWCSTTSNFDTDGKYGLCETEFVTTIGGNSDGKPCQFPFIFRNKTYNDCVHRSDWDRNRFCATTSNYDVDGKWGYCPNPMNMTIEGNSGNDTCVFPFIYRKKIYNSCTTDGRLDGWLWCSTTPNFDTDRKHSFCNNGYSLYVVAVHEIGHTLGLNHSANCLSVMYDLYGYVDDLTLDQIDINGVRSFYGPRMSPLPPLELEPCVGDEIYTTTTTAPTTTTTPTTTTPITTTTTTTTTTTIPIMTTTTIPITTTTATIPTTTTTEQQTTSTTSAQTTTATPATKTTTTTPVTTAIKTRKRKSKPTGSVKKIKKLRVKRPVKEICKLDSFDAGYNIYGFTFVFKDTNVWRWDPSLNLETGPYEIHLTYRGGPPTVDAAYVRPQDDTVILFKGQQYWEFDNGFVLRYGFPKPLTHFGFPSHVEKVDAAINWKRRRWTSFFVGDQFYSYNEKFGKMIKGNPKKIKLWNASYGSVTSAMKHPKAKKWSVVLVGSKQIQVNNYNVAEIKDTSLRHIFHC